MYKRAKIPKSIACRFGRLAGRCHVYPAQWSNENGCTEEKNKPVKRGMRRSADALKTSTYVEDKNSGELRRPHHIDLKTGMYRGRQVLTPKESA